MSEIKHSPFVLIGSDQPTVRHLCAFLSKRPDARCLEFDFEEAVDDGIDLGGSSRAHLLENTDQVLGVCLKLTAFGTYKSTYGLDRETALVVVNRKVKDAYLATRGFLDPHEYPGRNERMYFDITDYILFEKTYNAHKKALQQFCSKSGLRTLQLFHYELQQAFAFNRILEHIGADASFGQVEVPTGIWGAPVYRDLVVNYDEFIEYFDAKI